MPDMATVNLVSMAEKEKRGERRPGTVQAIRDVAVKASETRAQLHRSDFEKIMGDQLVRTNPHYFPGSESVSEVV